ncbi:MAG: type IV pilus assembly protein PilM [Zetaproteobacteria bacterium]|nr:MAG: type IV pilus assembly protein PilM [Zetaproteobacteria bacterium]
MRLFHTGKEGLVGLDIGASSVKLVELQRGRSGYRLRGSAIVPLPQGTVIENAIHDRQGVVSAIGVAMEQAGARSKRAAIAISGNAVIVKMILMPRMNELDLEEQIAYEAEQYVPFDLDELYLDFHVLGPSRKDPEQLETVVVACKRDVVDDYRSLLEEAGLELACVDCSVFTLNNVAGVVGEVSSEDIYHQDWSNRHAPQTTALANIGASLINMTVLIRDRLTFVRDHFYGGNQLTEAIQKHYGLSFEQAERMKLDRFSELDAGLVAGYFDDLASELMRSLEFYSAYHSKFPVERLLLSGGVALMPGITDALAERTGMQVDVIHPFPTIAIPPHIVPDAQALMQVGPRLVVPIGLALRAFDP